MSVVMSRSSMQHAQPVAAALNVSHVMANHHVVARSIISSSSLGGVRNVRCERNDESGRSRGEYDSWLRPREMQMRTATDVSM